MKKKIAILIPKMYGGGAERVAANLSNYLSDEQYEKYMIVYDSKNVQYTFNGEIIDLKTRKTKNSLVKVKNFIKRVYLTRKLKKKKKIDVTISLLSNPNLVNICSRKKDKVIISVRNFISESSTGFYGKIHKRLIMLMYNKADTIVVVSQALKEDLIKNFNIFKEKIQVINNFYDIENIRKLASEPVEKELQYIFSKPTVVTVGRLTEQKGQWHLIRAFKYVREKIPDAKLLILGQGSLEEYLKNLSSQLELSNDVHFLGFQSNPFKYISKSDIYILPSLYEGFPNALCEAMACGLPVISSDCKSGPREILSQSESSKTYPVSEINYTDYGILIPTCDGNKYNADTPLTLEELLMAESLIKLFKNKDLLMQYKKLSSQRAKHFKVEDIITKWEKLINLY